VWLVKRQVTPIHRSPRGQGHLLRERILEATVELMSAVDDASAISVRAVADRVSKTVPAIYQHFPDKGSLLIAASLHAFDAMGAAVSAEVADEPQTSIRLRRRAHAYVQFAKDHPAPYRLLFMTPPDSANRPGTLEVLLTTVGFNGMIEDLRLARAAGEMIDLDPPSVAIALWTAVHGVASLQIAHPGLDWPTTLLDQVLDQHAIGLSPR
jgi:AcrR family transcriptional regulator